ncbi:hypothetical protein [Chryseobacterium sp. MMS23-Vi53]|uniref:hypothetical protein n=1 Tax=Chryseobacterium sp. MMS23-Vi53 TaxID=3386644 RepID=UPI0039E8E739
MRLLFFLLLISSSLSAQSNNDLQNQIKLKNYSYLDSINIYSKEYPTQLIEGSGFIRNRYNKNIGSIGYSTEITKNTNDKIVRILKSETNHYEKFDGKPEKSIINEITIYFNDSQQPDLAKYISKTYIYDSLVTSKNKLFNLKENNDDNSDFKIVKILLDETKKYIK